MIWGFCVYFVYMIPLETDVLRKHRFQKDIFYSLYHHSYQYLCDCSYQFSLIIIHNHYLRMENQLNIQSANFYLVNTYFGIDVAHTYDGIDVTA